MSARYLLTFSYLGSAFRGSQKQLNTPNVTVQKVLDEAIQAFEPFAEAETYFSGRTDSGVHALGATAHVDLPYVSGKPFSPDFLAIRLNKHFTYTDQPIYVKKVQRVNPEFHARFNARARTYLYRLVLRSPGPYEDVDYRLLPLPIEEWKKSLFIRHTNFNVAKAKEAVKLFEGEHDFETFRKFVAGVKWEHSRRLLHSAELRVGSPMVTAFSRADAQNFQFLEFVFRGSGFVYNQVRRMVGTVIACAIGRLTTKDIELMLRIPSRNSWTGHAEKVSAHGLYLCGVEYDEEDLKFDEVKTEEEVEI